MRKTFLLTTCLGAFAVSGAQAATSTTTRYTHHHRARHRAAPAATSATPTAPTAPTRTTARAASPARPVQAAAQPESLVVLGAGASRETQTLTRSAIQQVAPGTNPLKTLSKLPGVMFTNSDPLGSYEWAQQIIIRGFDQSRLGFTMDGVPLGNLAYGNDDGLSLNRALEIENNGPITLAQGAGAVGVAASNDLGGAIQATSIDPTNKFGVDVAGTVGSAGTWRTFMRVNSGILPTGGKVYASYDYQDANKWKGDGVQRQQQANAKFVQPLGDHLKLTVFGDWSMRRENDYQDLSLATIQKYGYNVDNITGNYALAKQIASGSTHQCPAGIGTTNYGDCQDFAYWNSAGLRQDALGYGKLDFRINDRLKGFVTGYGHVDNGEGVWATPDTPTPASLGGTPISIRTTEYDIHREGFISSLSYELGRHMIEGGFWFENIDFEQARRYYPLPQTNPPGSIHWYKGDAFQTYWENAYNTRTYQFHLQDTWQATRALKLNYGFKALIADDTARSMPGNYLGMPTPNPYASGSIRAANGFLPQIGANYRLNHHNEVFADFARNMAAYDNSATGATSPFATTEAGYQAIKNKIHPEMSYTEELGYRYHDDTIQASLTGYYVEFEDRLLSITQGTGIQGNPAVLANVGGVTARGIDAAFNYQFTPYWSLYASYAFNNSFYNDNVTTSGVTYDIRNKNVVAMPRNLANVQLGYDDGRFWGNVLMQFQDRRTYTYENDQWVPANDVFNLNVGYRFHSHNIILRGLDAQVNVTNLFDKRYVASVGTNGFVFADPAREFATLQAASPRMVFFTLRKHF